jgi:hypothetical protein
MRQGINSLPDYRAVEQSNYGTVGLSKNRTMRMSGCRKIELWDCRAVERPKQSRRNVNIWRLDRASSRAPPTTYSPR